MGHKMIPSNRETAWRSFNCWREANDSSRDSNPSFGESKAKETVFRNDVRANIDTPSVSIIDVSKLWNDLEKVFFSSCNSKSKASINAMEEKRRNRMQRRRKSEKHNHRKRRMRHLLDGFPDPPSAGASFNRYGNKHYQIGGPSVMSTDSDDILNQTNSILIHSSTAQNVCVKSFESNPMDFEYFDKVIRSEDEAQQQLEWKRSRRLITQSHLKGLHEKRGRGNSMVDFQKVYDQELCPEKCKSPFHDEIVTLTPSEFQLSATIINLLQLMYTKSTSNQLQSVFLSSTKNKLFLFLNQFCADSLMMLIQNRHNHHFVEDDKHDMQMVLMKLMMTSLTNDLFDPDYIIHLQNNNIIHVSLVTLKELTKRVHLQFNENHLNNPDQVGSVQDVVEMNKLFLQVVRMFHLVGLKMHKRPGVKTSYMVCDWFCMENGADIINECLSLILRQIKLSEVLNEQLITSSKALFKEIGAFLSLTGVSEFHLIETQCTKRTTNVLKTMYLNLFKCLSTIATLDGKQMTHAGLIIDILDALMLDTESKRSCVNPSLIWNGMLNLILHIHSDMNLEDEQDELIHTKALHLLESHILHYYNHHSDNLTISDTNSTQTMSLLQGCSLTDSDSAFYDPVTFASDTSLEERTASAGLGEEQIHSCTFIEKYRTCLESSSEQLINGTLQHLTNIVQICPLKIRIQIIKSVFIPTLEELSQLQPPLNEQQSSLGQQLLELIEKMVLHDERLSQFCSQKNLFVTALKLSSLDGDVNNYLFVDDALQCAETFISTELRQCLKAKSSDTLSLPVVDSQLTTPISSSEASKDSDRDRLNEMEYINPSHPSISSNEMIKEVLSALMSESNERLLDKCNESISNLDLKILVRMWKIQSSLIWKYHEYALFFQQQHLYLTLIQNILQRLFKILLLNGPSIDKEILTKPIISLLGHLLKVLTDLSIHTNNYTSHTKSDTDLVLDFAMKSVRECLIPSNGEAARLKHRDLIRIMTVLLDAGIERVSEEKLTDSMNKDVESLVNSHLKNKTLDCSLGYVPDSDEYRSENELVLLQKTAVVEPLTSHINQRKTIVNKDILDLYVSILLDVENPNSNLRSLEKGPTILIDGLSRLLALITEEGDDRNR